MSPLLRAIICQMIWMKSTIDASGLVDSLSRGRKGITLQALDGSEDSQLEASVIDGFKREGSLFVSGKCFLLCTLFKFSVDVRTSKSYVA